MNDDRDAARAPDPHLPTAPDNPVTRPSAAPVDVPEVQAARAALAALAGTPVHGHPAIFDEVQQLLTAALDPQGAEAAGAR